MCYVELRLKLSVKLTQVHYNLYSIVHKQYFLHTEKLLKIVMHAITFHTPQQTTTSINYFYHVMQTIHIRTCTITLRVQYHMAFFYQI